MRTRRNGSEATREPRDETGHRGVEADDVEHARVVRVGDGESRRRHGHHDEPGVDAAALPVAAQRLVRVDLAGPGLVVGVDHEGVDLQALLGGVEHGQGAVRAAEGHGVHHGQGVVEATARRDAQGLDAVDGSTLPGEGVGRRARLGGQLHQGQGRRRLAGGDRLISSLPTLSLIYLPARSKYVLLS